jgi:hypothetical protein
MHVSSLTGPSHYRCEHRFGPYWHITVPLWTPSTYQHNTNLLCAIISATQIQRSNNFQQFSYVQETNILGNFV